MNERLEQFLSNHKAKLIASIDKDISKLEHDIKKTMETVLKGNRLMYTGNRIWIQYVEDSDVICDFVKRELGFTVRILDDDEEYPDGMILIVGQSIDDEIYQIRREADRRIKELMSLKR